MSEFQDMDWYEVPVGQEVLPKSSIISLPSKEVDRSDSEESEPSFTPSSSFASTSSSLTNISSENVESFTESEGERTTYESSKPKKGRKRKSLNGKQGKQPLSIIWCLDSFEKTPPLNEQPNKVVYCNRTVMQSTSNACSKEGQSTSTQADGQNDSDPNSRPSRSKKKHSAKRRQRKRRIREEKIIKQTQNSEIPWNDFDNDSIDSSPDNYTEQDLKEYLIAKKSYYANK